MHERSLSAFSQVQSIDSSLKPAPVEASSGKRALQPGIENVEPGSTLQVRLWLGEAGACAV